MIGKYSIALYLGLAAAAWPAARTEAQPAPAGRGTPASQPATTTAARVKQVLEVPPGFKNIKASNHSILVEPVDEAWVRESLASIQPTTMPSTMPADLLSRLKQNREALKKRIMTDLGIADAAVVEKYFTEKLEPALKRFEENEPPLFYIVSSEARLKELLKAGWTNPRFYYNRLADAVQLNTALTLHFGPEADDLLLPAVYATDATPAQKRERLIDSISKSESMLAAQIADRGMFECQAAFVSFIYEQSINPLKLKTDQDWFGVGVASMLSCVYLEMASGINGQDIQRNMTIDDPRNPIRATTIDVLRPARPEDMRADALPYYADAFRRKAGRAVLGWLNKGGDKSVAKVLAEIKKTPPADGPALVKLIQQVSGIDVSEDVKAGR